MNKFKLKHNILVISMLIMAFVLNGCMHKPNSRITEDKAGLSYSYEQSDNTNAGNLDYLSDGVSVEEEGATYGDNANITAEATIMVDESNEKILYQKNMYERIYPASVTKVLTALIAMEECSLRDVVTFSHDAVNISEDGAVVCGFEEGDKVSLKNLLYCMLIFSGNDTAVAIAEHVSGSTEEFSNLMNQRALELGCCDSHFVNSNGLHDENHYTTAYDMYLIFRQAVKYRIFRKIVNTDRYEITYKDSENKKHNMTVTSTNNYLLSSATPPDNVNVIGGKTGTTSDAGYCLALYSKTKNNNYI
nr:serine hydrolase [Lachnospiraceae bacterium]